MYIINTAAKAASCMSQLLRQAHPRALSVYNSCMNRWMLASKLHAAGLEMMKALSFLMTAGLSDNYWQMLLVPCR